VSHRRYLVCFDSVDTLNCVTSSSTCLRGRRLFIICTATPKRYFKRCGRFCRIRAMSIQAIVDSSLSWSTVYILNSPHHHTHHHASATQFVASTVYTRVWYGLFSTRREHLRPLRQRGLPRRVVVLMHTNALRSYSWTCFASVRLDFTSKWPTHPLHNCYSKTCFINHRPSSTFQCALSRRVTLFTTQRYSTVPLCT
jgi:hypothetical protein